MPKLPDITPGASAPTKLRTAAEIVSPLAPPPPPPQDELEALARAENALQAQTAAARAELEAKRQALCEQRRPLNVLLDRERKLLDEIRSCKICIERHRGTEAQCEAVLDRIIDEEVAHDTSKGDHLHALAQNGNLNAFRDFYVFRMPDRLRLALERRERDLADVQSKAIAYAREHGLVHLLPEGLRARAASN